MKRNIFAGVFLVVFLATYSSAHASLLSRFQTKVKQMTAQASGLTARLTANAIGILPIEGDTLAPVAATTTNDTTPRIAYWWGKVNQHINIDTTVWETDPDGSSGANLDKLTYCKKWYPNTASIRDYKSETITSWKDAGNLNGPYTSSVTSVECVQGQTQPATGSIDLKVNGSDTPSPVNYLSQLNVTWTSTNATQCYTYGHHVPLWDSSGVWTNTTVGTSGSKLLKAALAYSADISQLMNNNQLQIGIQCMFGNISMQDEVIVPVIQTQQQTPTIIVLSPNGGEVYAPGQTITVKWKTEGNISGKIGFNFATVSPNGGNASDYMYQTSVRNLTDDGSETIQIPSSIVPGSNYVIRAYILNSDGSSYNVASSDVSDAPFTVGTITQETCGINSFTTDSATVAPNSLVTLSWNTNCGYVGIAGMDGFPAKNFSSTGKTNTIVSSTTSFTLYGSTMAGCTGETYSSTSGQRCNYVTKTVTVNVGNTAASRISVTYPEEGKTYSQSTVDYIGLKFTSGTSGDKWNTIDLYNEQGQAVKRILSSYPALGSGAGAYLTANTEYSRMVGGHWFTDIPDGKYQLRAVLSQTNGTVEAETFSGYFYLGSDSTNLDSAQRIAYWYGKINQHADANGNWVSDPDGTSGANIDKLAYCKKWYPNTTSVQSYKSETINTWKRASYYEQSNYSATVTTDRCVQGSTSQTLKIKTEYVNPPGPTATSAYLVGSWQYGPSYITPQKLWFEYGTNRSLGQKTTVHSPDSPPDQTRESLMYYGEQGLNTLSPNTTYYFRACGNSSQGTVCGDVLTFKTLAPDTTDGQCVQDTFKRSMDTNELLKGWNPISFKGMKTIEVGTATYTNGCDMTLTSSEVTVNMKNGSMSPFSAFQIFDGEKKIAEEKVILWSNGQSKESISSAMVTLSVGVPKGYTKTLRYVGVIDPNTSATGKGTLIIGHTYSIPGPRPTIGSAGYTDGDPDNFVDATFIAEGSTDTCDSSGVPSLTVLTPNGGESYYTRSNLIFRWKPCGLQSGHFQVALEDEAGMNTYLPNLVPITQASYKWDIPSDFAPGKYKARIFCGKDNSEAYCTGSSTTSEDRSDDFFTIYNNSAGGRTSVNNAAAGSTSSYVFSRSLQKGTSGDDVKLLQKRLQQEGVYSGPVTGYFGSMTRESLKLFQTKKGITPLGIVGPQTRAILNR